MRIDRTCLAAEMIRRDWRDKRLVELSGISRATLSAIKGGKSCSVSTAEKIAKALNVPLEDLIKGAK